MLKKLAKYGNSTALVIDKAILELLEINDATMVKLHTDGKSLIVTPVKVDLPAGNISYCADEALTVALSKFKENNLNRYNNLDQTERDEISLENFNNSFDMQKEVNDLYLRFHEPFKRFVNQIFTSVAYQEELAKLTEKYDPVIQNVEYIDAMNKIKYSFVPELEKMDQEMVEITKKYVPQTLEFSKKCTKTDKD